MNQLLQFPADSAVNRIGRRTSPTSSVSRLPPSPGASRARAGVMGFAENRKIATNLTPTRSREPFQMPTDSFKSQLGTSRSGSCEPEALAKQAEWEREVQSLDQKEMEHHASRMKLITDQMSSFTRELARLNQVVGELQLQRETDAANAGATQEQTRRDHQDSQDDLASQLQQVLADHKEEFTGRLSSLQGTHGSAMCELQRALKLREQDHAQLHDRMNSTEGLLGDSADRLAALRNSHEEQAGFFSKHYQDFEALKGSHAQHATVPERLAFLEQLIGDSVDQTGSQVSRLQLDQRRSPPIFTQKAGNIGSAGSLGSVGPLSSWSGPASRTANFGARGFDNGSPGAAAGEATLKNRLDEVEKALGLHADSHSAFLDRHAQMESHHSTLGERVEYLEKALGDSADKHETEVKALHETWQQAHAKHAQDLQGLQALHGAHATVDERLNFVEKVLGDSADKHADELSRSRRGRGATSPASNVGINPILERLDSLESTVGDTHMKSSKALESLRSSHNQHTSAMSKHAQELQALASRHGEHAGDHATLTERVGYIEDQLGDSADKHAEHVADFQQRHGSLVDILGQVQSGAADHSATMNDRMLFLEQVVGVQSPGDGGGRAVRHAPVSERMDFLEKVIGSSADGQGIGVEQGTLEERLQLLERRTVDEMRTTNAKIDSCYNRMMLLRQAWCVDTPVDTPR